MSEHHGSESDKSIVEKLVQGPLDLLTAAGHTFVQKPVDATSQFLRETNLSDARPTIIERPKEESGWTIEWNHQTLTSAYRYIPKPLGREASAVVTQKSLFG